MIPHRAASCRTRNPDQKGGATRTVSGVGDVRKRIRLRGLIWVKRERHPREGSRFVFLCYYNAIRRDFYAYFPNKRLILIIFWPF